MSSFLKHVGILKNTSKKVIIVFHELPGTTDQALVCDMEALPPRMHDAVMGIVESQEAQRGEIKDIYELLSRRLFPDSGMPVINELHNRGYLQPVPQNNVYVMPRPNVQISLDHLMAEIKRLNPKKKETDDAALAELPADVRQAALEAQRQLNEKTLNSSENTTNNTELVNHELVSESKTIEQTVEKFNQHVHNQQADKNQSRIALAQSLLKQAALLQNEANQLISKAYATAPELNPAVNERFSESTVVTREKVVSNSDLPKARSPGRPRKSSANTTS